MKWTKKVPTEDIEYATPERSSEEPFARDGDEIHKTLIWTGGCKSWSKRNRVDGREKALFGGSVALFSRMLADIRGEDFEIEYHSPNFFRLMGNRLTA